MCLPSLVTDTLRRFLRLESSKKLQGRNARGVASPPLGVRGLINKITGKQRQEHSQCQIKSNQIKIYFCITLKNDSINLTKYAIRKTKKKAYINYNDYTKWYKYL